MRGPRTCPVLPSASDAPRDSRSPGWCRRPSSNTLSNTDFTQRCRRIGDRNRILIRPRQAGCMAKTERRKKATRIPSQVEHAIRAAEDKQAVDLVVLDLRKAQGFT